MEKIERPKSLPSVSRKLIVGCGSLYITTGSYNGRVIEVIASLGRAGGCASAQNEALGKVISLGLKWGVPIEEYVEELKGIGCPSPNLFPADEKCLSCADGFAKALEENGYQANS